MKKVNIILVVSIIILAILIVGFFVIKGLGRCPLMRSGAKADNLYKTATELLSQGKTDEAIFEFQRIIAEYPQSGKAAAALLNLGDAYLKKAMLLEAREAFQRVIDEHSDSPFVKQAQQRLGDANISLLFSPIITESSTTYTVKQGDTLDQIANKFNTTVDLISKCNSVKSTTLRPGMQLKIPVIDFSVIVDKAQNTLILKADEGVVKVYQVSTGKDTSITPSGTFKVVNRIKNPTWYAPGGRVIPAGNPENILGSRWLGLDKPGYGIHGTTEPSSIGRSVTAGCVRMLNEDVNELFVILPVGTEVTILD
jgi:lipoprotein-anchoring transpeptidase ErfK/SrfK